MPGLYSNPLKNQLVTKSFRFQCLIIPFAAFYPVDPFVINRTGEKGLFLSNVVGGEVLKASVLTFYSGERGPGKDDGER